MGILGNVKLVRRSRKVLIGLSETGEEVWVTVTAPPLHLADELAEKIPEPDAPIVLNDKGEPRWETNPRTGEAIKNEKGQLVPRRNREDPEWLREVESVGLARMTALIFACTDFPGETSVRREKHTPVSYELARWKELEDEGCGRDVFRALQEAVTSLSRPMSRDEIEEARQALGTDKATQASIKEILREQGEKVPEGKSE